MEAQASREPKSALKAMLGVALLLPPGGEIEAGTQEKPCHLSTFFPKLNWEFQHMTPT